MCAWRLWSFVALLPSNNMQKKGFWVLFGCTGSITPTPLSTGDHTLGVAISTVPGKLRITWFCGVGCHLGQEKGPVKVIESGSFNTLGLCQVMSVSSQSFSTALVCWELLTHQQRHCTRPGRSPTPSRWNCAMRIMTSLRRQNRHCYFHSPETGVFLCCHIPQQSLPKWQASQVNIPVGRWYPSCVHRQVSCDGSNWGSVAAQMVGCPESALYNHTSWDWQQPYKYGPRKPMKPALRGPDFTRRTLSRAKFLMSCFRTGLAITPRRIPREI